MTERSWWQSRKLTLSTLVLGTVLIWSAVIIVVFNELTMAPTLAESALQEPGSVAILSSPINLTLYLILLVSVDYCAYHVIQQNSGAVEWLARASYAAPMSLVLVLPDGLDTGLYAAFVALFVLFPVMYATEGTWDRWLSERISARKQGA